MKGVYSSSLVIVGAVWVMTAIGLGHGIFTYQSSFTDVVAGGLIGAGGALFLVGVIARGLRELCFSLPVFQRLALVMI